MKITLATIKSFIRKNPNLYIKSTSRFDGMYDCVMPNQNAQFELAQTPAENQNHKNYSYIHKNKIKIYLYLNNEYKKK